MTKREIYYSAVQLFDHKQSAADAAIEHCVETISRISTSYGAFCRQSLGIIAARRGLVFGPITWRTEDGERMNGMNGTGTSIEPRVDNIDYVQCADAAAVIVVEKETVFHRLATEYHDAFPNLIFITGKGYPDVGTRLFLKFLLEQKPELKAFALMDGDPHGIDILSVYVNGSAAMAYAGAELCVPQLKWLGAPK